MSSPTPMLWFPPGYGLVLLEAISLCIICASQSVAVSTLREKLFTPAFFKANFPDLHPPYPQHGYPDTGNGRYSSKLSNEDWIKFNSAQRAHLNMLESLTFVLLGLVIAGLVYTRLTLAAGIIYGVGRIMYGKGYREQGPEGRNLGGKVQAVGGTSILFLSIAAAWQITGGLHETLTFLLG